MPPFATMLINWLIHSGLRFISVVCFSIVIIGLPLGIYRAGANSGYKKGYSQALTDHPQQIYTAPATVNNNPPRTSAIYGVKLGRSWGFGICHE